MARDSPKLYKHKVLSGWGEKEFPKASKSTETLVKPIDNSQKPLQEIGSFENPVLQTLANRTVNKELETQRLVVNIVSLAIWDLLNKISNTLATHSSWGKQFMALLAREMTKSGIRKTVTHLYSKYPRLFEEINWKNLNLTFHIIVIVNVVISLWRLFAKVKTDDLKLTESQKKLLGVEEKGKDISREDQTAIEELRSAEQSTRSPPQPPNTPFLFKSLETPMKTKRRELTEEPQRKTQSAGAKKSNAFGTLEGALPRGSNGSLNTRLFAPSMTNSAGPLGTAAAQNFSTPVRRTGYIPSSKYTYMMNSPSPRKRV